MNNKKGFTLVEIIVVVSIISLLYLGINKTLVNIIDIFQLKNEAQELALNLHNLRNSSLRLSKDTICYLNDNNYILKMRNYDGSEEMLRTVLLEKNIFMSGIEKVGFKFNGNSLYSGTILMTTNTGFHKKIIVAVATGRIRVE